MGGKKEIYRDVGFFHGAIQLYQIVPQINKCVVLLSLINITWCRR